MVIGTLGQEGLASLLTLCAGSVRATWGLVVVGAVTGLYRLVGQLLTHVWVCTADGSQIAEGLWSPNGEWYIQSWVYVAWWLLDHSQICTT